MVVVIEARGFLRLSKEPAKYPFHIDTNFGRPKILGRTRSTCISLYEKYVDVYPLACDLARLDGKSFSELVSIALKEYVETHYPGNPQLVLPSLIGETPLPLRLQAKFDGDDFLGLYNGIITHLLDL